MDDVIVLLTEVGVKGIGMDFVSSYLKYRPRYLTTWQATFMNCSS
jgi:hypothetical protein